MGWCWWKLTVTLSKAVWLMIMEMEILRMVMIMVMVMVMILVMVMLMKTHSDSFKGGVVESTDETPLPLGIPASSCKVINIQHVQRWSYMSAKAFFLWLAINSMMMMMMIMICDDDKVGLDGGTWPVGIPLWKVELRTFCIKSIITDSHDYDD